MPVVSSKELLDLKVPIVQPIKQRHIAEMLRKNDAQLAQIPITLRERKEIIMSALSTDIEPSPQLSLSSAPADVIIAEEKDEQS